MLQSSETFFPFSIQLKARLRSPPFLRQRSWEPTPALTWRRLAACCPLATASPESTVSGMCRPRRWWNSRLDWRLLLLLLVLNVDVWEQRQLSTVSPGYVSQPGARQRWRCGVWQRQADQGGRHRQEDGSDCWCARWGGAPGPRGRRPGECHRREGKNDRVNSSN